MAIARTVRARIMVTVAQILAAVREHRPIAKPAAAATATAAMMCVVGVSGMCLRGVVGG